jgi:hypothetical protein
MNRLRQTGVVFLVVLVLAGTAGFNVWHHICACRPVVVEKVHSCCEKSVPEPVRTADACGTGCAHDHKGCRNVPVWFKAPIVAVPAVQKVSLPELVQAMVTELPFIPVLSAEPAGAGFTLSHEKPPPLSGKELVFFLHQLRIPYSA